MTQAPKNHIKTILTVTVSLAVAVFFMWLAFRGLDFKKIAGYFAEANYFWVFCAAFFGILAYWIRAVRWNLLFQPLGYSIADSNAFWSISFGYLMNLTIPRSGELARATALYGVEGVPVDKSFGTIILERVVDLFCMMGFLLLTILFKREAIITFYDQANIPLNPKLVFGLIFLVIIGTFIFFKYKDHFTHIPVLGKVIAFVEGIFHGITSIFKLKQKIKFIVLSIAIWGCYYLASYLVCFALPETSGFTFADGFFIIVVGTLGMMVPASGGIGAFHFAMKLGIGALFLSMGKSFASGSEVGLAYAFISHTMQFIIMVVFGVISIPFLAKARNGNARKKDFL